MPGNTMRCRIGRLGRVAALAMGGVVAAACSPEVPIAERVQEHLERGETARALDLVETAARGRPADSSVRDLRVRVLVRAQGGDAGLSRYAERWSQGEPDSPATFREVAVALLREGLQAPDGFLRNRAAAALAAWRAPELLPVFREALANPDASVRALAAEGLGKVPGDDAEGILRGALDDPKPEVRAAAAASLAGRSSRETQAALRNAVREDHPKVR
ncbi:MAG: HEAT repeat domain-containing protein, partial [Zetaproteobacteria bacterium]